MKMIYAVLFSCFFFVNSFALGVDESDSTTSNGNAYIISTVVSAGPGFRSIGQLWNPIGSNKVVYVDKFAVSHGYCDSPSGVDMRFGTTPFGVVYVNGRNKNVSVISLSGTQLRSAHYIAPLPDQTLYELFEGGCYRNATVSLVPPIRLDPGSGVYLSTGNDNANLPVTFEFREYHIQ